MKLSQLSAKPQLIKLVLDDEEIIKEYGEAIEFYTWDRQPLDIFMKLASVSQSNSKDMFGIVKTMLLDENAKEIVTEDQIPPSNILLKAIVKIVDLLGK
jgi:hypothetical protein